MAQFLIQISYLRLCSPINVAISRHVTGINAPLPFHKLAHPAQNICKTRIFGLRGPSSFVVGYMMYGDFNFKAFVENLATTHFTESGLPG